MYLYRKDDLGECAAKVRASLGGWGRFGLVEGFGQAPWEQLSRGLREIESNRVVQAIRRLPEGKVCPAPEHMAAYEQRIREKLQGSFDVFELEKGISLWRLSLGYPPHPPRQQIPVYTGPSMRAIQPSEIERGIVYTAQGLEQRFLLAERTGDVEGMAKAAEEFYELLGRFPSQARKPMSGRGSMEKQREQIAQIRDNILRQAPNLARIVNTLASRGLPVTRRLMVEHLRQRVLVRQQRSRARR